MHTIRFTALAVALLAAAATTASAQHQQGARHHRKIETQAELQKEAKMTMAEARELALKTVPNATIKSGEIEREGGKLIYSFDMKVAGKSGIDEVNIDAMTGKLESNKHESAKAEKAEAKADKKAEEKAESKSEKKMEEKAELKAEKKAEEKTEMKGEKKTVKVKP